MKKNIFESQWTMIGNVIMLASLIVALRVENEFTYVCYMFLILAIPFYILGLVSVIQYNNIVTKGEKRKAEILPQSFQLKKSYRGTSQFEYICRDRTQYYKGIVSVKDKDVEKMQKYVKVTPDIDVVVDDGNNKSIILIKPYLNQVCYCLDGYFCEAKINYIMCAIVVLLLVISIL